MQIGSKKFTESVLLGELAYQLAAEGGLAARHRREIGGSRVLWDALQAGDIDVYPEYTGTIMRELLADERLQNQRDLTRALSRRGIKAGAALGFNNTYALGMREADAQRLGITRISDLRNHPQLRYGLTSEFMDRADGWPGLAKHYGLSPESARGLDHDLAYRGVAAGTIDVTDVYTTDADIELYGLRVLQDDRDYFPEYQALFLYREALLKQRPQAFRSIERLAGTLDEATMRKLNAQVKVERAPERAVGARFLAKALSLQAPAQAHQTSSRLQRLLQHGAEHLALTGSSLLAAILVAVPLGIAAARRRTLGQLILSLTGILQTIPSLALLVFMIPLFGIGAPPAIAALFLYSLLPIVRNTHAGLQNIDRRLLESAHVLGLRDLARLRLIELPLAAPSILAGIKTSAVINVGTATLGALIGAGGYGQPILTGIRLNDQALILEGAIPAALLALLCQGIFDASERLFLPRGLRL